MYIKIDCACIGVIFDSTLVLLIILITLDGVGLKRLWAQIKLILKVKLTDFGHFKETKICKIRFSSHANAKILQNYINDPKVIKISLQNLKNYTQRIIRFTFRKIS